MAQFRLKNGSVYGSVSCTSLGDGFFRFDIQLFSFSPVWRVGRWKTAWIPGEDLNLH